MAKVTESITFQNELRPCMIGDKKALFHTWYQWYETVSAELLVGGRPAGQLGDVYGLVELEDGSMRQVPPEGIKFIDSKFKEYNFGGKSKEINRNDLTDEETVRHGEWIHDGMRFKGGVDWYHCSACGNAQTGVFAKAAFCSACGAKMVGGKTE